MDFKTLVAQRLAELGLKQSDLATAAQVTPSYISQILRGKKLPPSPSRSDFYDRIEKVVQLRKGTLSSLVAAHAANNVRHQAAPVPKPLFPEVRETILKKCDPQSAGHVRDVFNRRPFGVVERIVAEKLLEVIKSIIRVDIDRTAWMNAVGERARVNNENLRIMMENILNSDILSVNGADLALLLDILIDRWDVDLSTFAFEIKTDPKLTPGHEKTFELIETEMEFPGDSQPGFKKFLANHALSGDASDSEIDFLRRLRFDRKKPTALFYYRALQNLRDPIHFDLSDEEA